VRQNIMEVHDGTNLITSWQPGEGDWMGKREKERTQLSLSRSWLQ
jgi:hypothetical protein